MREKSIRERLENWARWSRGGSPHEGESSMTALICERLKKAKLGLLGTGPDAPEIDNADAAMVNDAWKVQMPRHKKLLHWYYVRNGDPTIICRKLGIKVWPASVFELERVRAETAMQKTLDNIAERNRIPPNNLIPST